MLSYNLFLKPTWTNSTLNNTCTCMFISLSEINFMITSNNYFDNNIQEVCIENALDTFKFSFEKGLQFVYSIWHLHIYEETRVFWFNRPYRTGASIFMSRI